MKIVYSPAFVAILKKSRVLIRKSFKERIALFVKNPDDPQLRNHSLQREWKGYRSIDITVDWRAIYTLKHEGEEIIAYFITLGTHKKLYRK